MPIFQHQRIGLELTARSRPQYQIGVGTYNVPKHFHVIDWHQGSTLKIGAYCSLAYDAKVILGGDHRIDWVTTHPFSLLWQEAAHIPGHPSTKGDVVIGNDVWVGFNATVLSGVTIGDGAVIGANATVVSDVPAYTIVGGNPAQAIRKRFDERTIARLLEVQWWNWSEEKIENMLPLLLSPDIEAFLTAAESAG